MFEIFFFPVVVWYRMLNWYDNFADKNDNSAIGFIIFFGLLLCAVILLMSYLIISNQALLYR